MRVDTLFRSSATYEPGLRAGFGGMVRGPDGRLYFIDHESSALVRLIPGDTTLARVGRNGEGPGDLGRPAAIGMSDDGASIIVFEDGNRRYSMFDTSMVFTRSFTVDASRNGRSGPLLLARRHLAFSVCRSGDGSRWVCNG
ncbi:MAG: hypothetical protein H0W15_01910 [Gemmatimonadales bacterium]|nr:hypothetical protein [Gemmatimonadales bacterium]